ncbi:MAG: hypothetical protein CVV44_21865 [Spirochaetae bacterium HGW-Spirochaetae-1]|jgi:cell division protein FtsI (penicillin-binding protein 3)/stage V sporulation protein D (sporulation-specific penicillin-binding protein)|nr:MAG: hypothetical protein CVV44_21865 [Spirochaetae bacterium HGW-Spirochaetae-1]
MNQKVFKGRVIASAIIIIGVSLIFFIRLFSLHFSPKLTVADRKKPEVRRGLIKDHNGYILAMSIRSESLFANPGEMDDRGAAARLIGPIIGAPPQWVLERISQEKKFVWLKRKLPGDTADRIRALNIRGLYFRNEYKRVYPHGDLAANVLGLVGIDNRGLEGIEFYFNDILSAKEEISSASDIDEIVMGRNVNLTIDRFIQYTAQKELDAAALACNAKQGAVVVMDIKTGKILGMAKYPSFNPGDRSTLTGEALRNFAVIDSFEPGSTMKIISLASMLENDPSVLKKWVTCSGSIVIGDTTIGCPRSHGHIGMPDIIRYSCNVGIIESMKKYSKESLYKTLDSFGFGKRTGIELPGEFDGILRPPSAWSGLSKYSISIGYEISVTSLQLVSAFAAIANGGVYNSPSIIESIENGSGGIIQEFYPRSRGKVVNEKTARILLQLMQGVVRDGTGARAGSRYYAVAGKTGTSQKYSRRGGAYSDRSMSSFIGIAPVSAPSLCILIVLDDPGGSESGGEVAAPVFARIIDRVLPQMGVKGEVLKAAAPLFSRERSRNIDARLMPDFRGRSLEESVYILTKIQKQVSVEYAVQGTGKVQSQKPVPGTALRHNDTLVLYLGE